MMLSVVMIVLSPLATSRQDQKVVSTAPGFVLPDCTRLLPYQKPVVNIASVSVAVRPIRPP